MIALDYGKREGGRSEDADIRPAFVSDASVDDSIFTRLGKWPSPLFGEGLRHGVVVCVIQVAVVIRVRQDVQKIEIQLHDQFAHLDSIWKAAFGRSEAALVMKDGFFDGCLYRCRGIPCAQLMIIESPAFVIAVKERGHCDVGGGAGHNPALGDEVQPRADLKASIGHRLQFEGDAGLFLVVHDVIKHADRWKAACDKAVGFALKAKLGHFTPRQASR